ncbi:MAG: hypothetical protein GXX90_05125 [Microbacteriaceae bacterium]|nr:hypothetical protein [Microbacteriaceae bacterium]
MTLTPPPVRLASLRVISPLVIVNAPGGELGPLLGGVAELHALEGDLLPGALGAGDVEVHGADAAAVRGGVAGDLAAGHRRLAVAEHEQAAAGEAGDVVRDGAAVDLDGVAVAERLRLDGRAARADAPVVGEDAAGPAGVLGDEAAVDDDVAAVVGADAAGLAVRGGGGRGTVAVADLAAVDGDGAAGGDGDVARAVLAVRGAAVVGDLAAVEGERGVGAGDGHSALVRAAEAAGALDLAGVHHELAAHVDGGGAGRGGRAVRVDVDPAALLAVDGERAAGLDAQQRAGAALRAEERRDRAPPGDVGEVDELDVGAGGDDDRARDHDLGRAVAGIEHDARGFGAGVVDERLQQILRAAGVEVRGLGAAHLGALLRTGRERRRQQCGERDAERHGEHCGEQSTDRRGEWEAGSGHAGSPVSNSWSGAPDRGHERRTAAIVQSRRFVDTCRPPGESPGVAPSRRCRRSRRARGWGR